MTKENNVGSSTSLSSEDDEVSSSMQHLRRIPLAFWHDLAARAALLRAAAEGCDIDTYPELLTHRPILWIRQRTPDSEARFHIAEFEANYQHILAQSPRPTQRDSFGPCDQPPSRRA